MKGHRRAWRRRDHQVVPLHSVWSPPPRLPNPPFSLPPLQLIEPLVLSLATSEEDEDKKKEVERRRKKTKKYQERRKEGKKKNKRRNNKDTVGR